MSMAFSPPSDAVCTAALLAREKLLTEQAQHLEGASYRRHCEIEDELAKVQRLLKGLGFGNKNLRRYRRSRLASP